IEEIPLSRVHLLDVYNTDNYIDPVRHLPWLLYLEINLRPYVNQLIINKKWKKLQGFVNAGYDLEEHVYKAIVLSEENDKNDGNAIQNLEKHNNYASLVRKQWKRVTAEKIPYRKKEEQSNEEKTALREEKGVVIIDIKDGWARLSTDTLN